MRVVQHVSHGRRRGRGVAVGRHPEHAGHVRRGRVLQTRGHAELLLGDQFVALLHLLPLLGAAVLEPDLDLEGRAENGESRGRARATVTEGRVLPVSLTVKGPAPARPFFGW